MDPLPPCPYPHLCAEGAHNLNAILPDTAEHPATLLFCDRCGIVRTFSLDPIPLDSLTAVELERLLAGRTS